MKKTIFVATIIILVLCFAFTSASPSEAEQAATLEQLIQDIIQWKIASLGSDTLMTSEFLDYAGSTAGDWFPFALGRYGYSADYAPYLAAVTENVTARYETPEKLDKAKATEWHRIALAIAAVGGNPRSVGESYGKSIDLIADGTYNRANTASLGKQGINGYIWALIALDSGGYPVPDDAATDRSDIIIEILKRQLEDGGVSLYGSASDPDVTAMAITALAPYYFSEAEYTYTLINSTEKPSVTRKARDFIQSALSFLSSAQQSTGDYISFGQNNAESVAWVMLSLCSLDIDPLTDTRFIKNGNTLLNGLLLYKTESGGFTHSYENDPDNPTAVAGKPNSMASEQVLYALTALWRQQNKMRSLFDITAELTPSQREEIARVALLCKGETPSEAQDAVAAYFELPDGLKRYIGADNYMLLTKLAQRYSLQLPEGSFTGSGSDSEEVILYFSQSHRDAADALPSVQAITTQYYAEINSLRYVLSKSEDFEGKEHYQARLEELYQAVSQINREIALLNSDIAEALYPFEGIGLGDKEIIYALWERYESLSEYDKSKLTHLEALQKCKTLVDVQTLAIVISAVCVMIAAIITLNVIIRIRKRKKAKLMPESEE